MSPVYIVLHAILSVLCLLAVYRFAERRAQAFALMVLLIAVTCFVVERRSDWAGILLPVVGARLVFVTNWALETATVLIALLWRSATERRAKSRALVLSVPLFLAAFWSYAWYFAPLPQPLTGTPDRTGYCPQSTPDSCSAAAAVMLLHLHGVITDEAEMANLSLTRAGLGTPTLGLVYGLECKAEQSGLHVHLVKIASTTELAKQHLGCILSVGLKRGLPEDVETRMRGYGWEPGVHHAVVVVGGDPQGAWLDVADPSYGHEHWPRQDFAYIWDGYALILTP